jgi:hypothetical protein
MKPDQLIEIQLVNGDGKPLAVANVLMNIYFFTKGNFRYAFGLGFTDANGHLRASYSDIEESRRKNSEFWVMDYNTELDECDLQVKIFTPSEQYLREANEKALQTFGEPPPWAKTWPANAQVKVQKEEIYVELKGPTTQVEIPAQPA